VGWHEWIEVEVVDAGLDQFFDQGGDYRTGGSKSGRRAGRRRLQASAFNSSTVDKQPASVVVFGRPLKKALRHLGLTQRLAKHVSGDLIVGKGAPSVLKQGHLIIGPFWAPISSLI